MNKFRIASLLLTAVISCQMLVSCGGSKNESSDAKGSSAVSSETVKKVEHGMHPSFEQGNDEAFSEESCAERVLAEIKDAEPSDEPPVLSSLGDIVSPSAEDIDGDLGDYRETENGVKLYFEEEHFPEELMLTLEQYFLSIENADYTLYTQCVYPEYFDRMTNFLQTNYQHDMKESFSSQCAQLAALMNGGFKLTRIKVEPAEPHEDGTDNLADYFGNLESLFEIEEGSFYDEVKKNTDNIYDATFFVMAQGKEDHEDLIISEYEIIFVEKDGRYYIFG